MFSNVQVETFLKNLGLKYEVRSGVSNSGLGSTWFCVYDKNNQLALEYNPFSCWIVDLRTNQKYHSDTVTKFKSYCQKLSQED